VASRSRHRQKEDPLIKQLVRDVAVVIVLLSMLGGGPARAEEEYVLGVDDVLFVQVWDNKDLEQTVPVRPDGKISFPLVGDVTAAGLTVSQLKSVLAERLAASVKNPTVSVVVKEIHSFRVFFIGRVVKPGVYPIKAGTPLLQALTLAGGVADGADQQAAYVVRGGTRIRVNLQRLIQDGDLTQNVPLHTDDTVVVPGAVTGEVQSSVFIMGEVTKPGSYPRSEALTLMKLISLAGGFTKFAAPGRITVIRERAASGDASDKERLRVDVDAIQSDPRRHADVPLKSGDVVVVPPSLF
jgi:polysaccharide biosynthesis/export protein